MLSFRLAFFSVKKKKEFCVILTLFILMAVMFLDMGISVYQRADKIFYEKTRELNETHLISPCVGKTYKSEFEDYLKKAEGVICFEREENAFMQSSTNNRNELELGAILCNKDAKREIAPFRLVEEDTSVPVEKAIYVPVQLKSENVLLGEPYELTYRGKTYSFVVAGYFESTTYCNVNSGFYRYFVADKTYEGLINEIGKGYLLKVQFGGTEKEILNHSKELKASFLKNTTYATDQQNLLQNALDYEDLQLRSVMNLLVGIAILFSVAVLICLVILFIVINYIREDINKSMDAIGTLQSMGYTLKQIKFSYFVEYMLLGMAGGLSGVALSYLCNQLMAPFLTGLCGFRWKGFAHPAGDVISFSVMIILIAIGTTLATQKLHGLTPVDALCQRKGNQKGYRSFFPLQNGSLPVNLHIAIKNVVIHLRSNLVYTFIVLIGSFAIGVSLILYLNFASHSDSLLKVTGIELADLQVKVSQGCDVNAFSKELGEIPGVRKTSVTTTGDYLKYNNEAITTLIMQDFSKMEFIKPYEGSYPQTENEVMISAILSKDSDKGVGDSITFESNGSRKSYLVSGILSSTNGYLVYMNGSAIRFLYPDFQFNCIDLYLDSEQNPDSFKEFLETKYKVSVDNASESIADQKIARLLADYNVSSLSYSIWKDGVEIYAGNSSAFCISEITNLRGFVTAQVETYTRNLGSMVLVVFVSMLLIIGCVLQVTTKSEIRKNQHEYGTLKALGYTTRDISSQISLRFLMTTIIGCMTGAVLGFSTVPSIMGCIFRLMGVTQFAINGYPIPVFIFSCLLCAGLFLVTCITCRRIRNITAYSLLSE